MIFNSEFNKENILAIYEENKQFILPLVAIIISILLLLFLILPQIIAFPSNKAEADRETVKLNKMQAAYDYLIKLDEQIVNSNLTLAQKALPDKKDFGSVLNAISIASGKSSTQIFDYKFQESSGTQTKYPTLLFNIEIIGGIREAISFINELYKVYPLSTVAGFSSANNFSKINVNFYYRAFPPITEDDRLTVTKMNNEQQSALETISKWDIVDIEVEVPLEATSSSTTSPF